MANKYYENVKRLEIKEIEKAKKDSLAWLSGTLGSALLFLLTITFINLNYNDKELDDAGGIISLILICLSSFGISICGVNTIDNLESIVKHKKKAKYIEENKNNIFLID